MVRRVYGRRHANRSHLWPPPRLLAALSVLVGSVLVVASDEGPDQAEVLAEGDDAQGVGLSTAEAKAIARAAALGLPRPPKIPEGLLKGVSLPVVPEGVLKGIGRIPALPDGLLKGIGGIKLPESVLKNAAGASALAAANSDWMKKAAGLGILAGQPSWMKNAGAISGLLGAQSAINSDVFLKAGLAQSQIGLIAGHLSKSVDFSGIGLMGDAVAKMVAQQTSWLDRIGPLVTDFRAAFYPPNLRAIDGLDFEQVEAVVMVDGIPLYGVPRTSIAEALVNAETAAKRREVLGRQWRAISEDCRQAVGGCECETLAPYVPMAVKALDALDAGHTEAAQALAGAIIDTLVKGYFGKDRTKYTPHPQGKRTNEAYNDFTVREFVAFAPMWQAYQQFDPANGDKVPGTFSRHATAHTVSKRQYNRRNAVQALLFACSLLYRFNEVAVDVERRESRAKGRKESAA